MTTADDPKLIYMPLDKIHTADGYCFAYRNRWWSIHPERGLIFYCSGKKKRIDEASPQCNSDEATSRALTARMYPWAEVRFFEFVLAPIDPYRT